jgi:hypothetical protein
MTDVNRLTFFMLYRSIIQVPMKLNSLWILLFDRTNEMCV